jgi:hypothetical protein
VQGLKLKSMSMQSARSESSTPSKYQPSAWIDLKFRPELLPYRSSPPLVPMSFATESRSAGSPGWSARGSVAVLKTIQRCSRLNASRYRYESAGGKIITELEVDSNGFVTGVRILRGGVAAGPKPDVPPAIRCTVETLAVHYRF